MMSREGSSDAIRVLVCDDYYLIREGLKSVLESQPDFEVVAEAESGEDALQLVEELLPDVVIMDVVMLGMDGIEATRRIKHAHPSVSVVVLTRYDDIDHIMEIYRSGASAYLVKSVKEDELVRTVRAVYGGSVVLHPQAAGAVIKSFRQAGADAQGPSRAGLSPREVDVLKLVARGRSNKEIARELRISLRTAQNHLGNIFRKLELNDRVSAAVYAIKEGITSPEEVAPAGASSSWRDVEVSVGPSAMHGIPSGRFAVAHLN